MAIALPIFAITLFTSAFLLFLVQPMIGKMILPSLGGTPQVWNTCVVFFQAALLAGYAYTHTVSTRLKLRAQLIAHGALLLIPLVLLFTGTFNEKVRDFVPPPGSNPIPATLLLLTIVVGLPFFVVSTSAPLLQKWFGGTGHPSAKDPYFLYGASNLGSMLSLFCYPFLVEPSLALSEQSWAWTGGYVFLVLLYYCCVGLVWNAKEDLTLNQEEKPILPVEEVEPKSTSVTAKAPAKTPLSSKIRKGSKQKGAPGKAAPVKAAAAVSYTDIRSDDVDVWRRLRWVLLAAVPSSLMLGITTYISTDVSAIPLFWVLPLAMYLFSFILVFMRWPIKWTGVPHTLMVIAQPIFVFCFMYLLITHKVSPIWRSISFSMIAFFITTMVCHGEMARDRPSTKHLTEFYLWMSVGGVVGGIFNALIAPVVFTYGLMELPIAIALGFAVRPFTSRLAPVDKPLLIAYGGAIALLTSIFLFYGEYVTPDQFTTFIGGVFIGTFAGIVYGAAFNFDGNTLGTIDDFLVNTFPGMGAWFDAKAKELKQSGQPQEEEATPKKKISKEAPDYSLMGYTFDIVFPLIIAVLVGVFTYAQSSILQGSYKMFQTNFGMKADSAGDYARSLVLFLTLGLPAFFALLFSKRPLRFGLTIGIMLFISFYSEMSRESSSVLRRDRSYFGVLRVLAQPGDPLSAKEAAILQTDFIASGGLGDPSMVQAGYVPPYTYLMHGTTHHGLNYQAPKGLRRLATTYYHRKGPVGVIFERFNWFPDPNSNITFWADSRFPAALVASAAPMMNFTPIPTDAMAMLQSEPPYATIGLGTGTMASYGRPFQHVTFYEIDNKIKSFSMDEFDLSLLSKYGLPDNLRGPYFNYLKDALDRGVNLEVVMGDARLAMREKLEQDREKDREGGNYQVRELYYHAIEIDAFSSDAIPVHLISKEAMQQYFRKTVEGGVLMVHTSNRHVDLVKPVADIVVDLNKDLAKRIPELASLYKTNKSDFDTKFADFMKTYPLEGAQLKRELDAGKTPTQWNYAYIVGNDMGEGRSYGAGRFLGTGDRGHFQSEYVMVARDKKYLPEPTPEEKLAHYVNFPRNIQDDTPPLRWTIPRAENGRVWTDDYSNLLDVFRWGF